LQTAPEAVAEYFDEVGGRPKPPRRKKATSATGPAGAKSAKKRRISGVESPASAPGSGKRGRPKRRPAADDEDGEGGSEEASGAGAGADDYPSLKKLGYPQEHDWDPHIQQVI